jgi:hypothetical protein
LRNAGADILATPVTALILIGLMLVSPVGLSGCTTSPTSITASGSVERTLDDFHGAASRADGDRYFGHLAPDAVFIGTDATERWERDAFIAFCVPYFDRGQGWTYVPLRRHVQLSPDGRLAWFDELLDNEKYGVCRGVGVLRRTRDGWEVVQYALSLSVPNDVAGDVVQVIESYESSHP